MLAIRLCPTCSYVTTYPQQRCNSVVGPRSQPHVSQCPDTIGNLTADAKSGYLAQYRVRTGNRLTLSSNVTHQQLVSKFACPRDST